MKKQVLGVKKKQKQIFLRMMTYEVSVVVGRKKFFCVN